MRNVRFKAFSFATLCGLVLSALFATPASAVIIVDFENVSIVPGGQQTVDVTIRSTSDDPIFLYEASLVLDDLNATTGTSVTFIDPLDTTFIDVDSDYVFFDNSNWAELPPGSRELFDNAPDNLSTFTTDETASGINRLPSLSADPVLLSRVTIQHNLGDATPGETIGDEFQIDLGQRFGFGEDVFFDDEFESIAYEVGNIGTITVIPEPGTFGFATLATFGMIFRRRRR